MKIVASASQYAIDSTYSKLHKGEVRYVWEIDVLNDVVAYVTASKRVRNWEKCGRRVTQGQAAATLHKLR
jgi:hypothetical protein